MSDNYIAGAVNGTQLKDLRDSLIIKRLTDVGLGSTNGWIILG